MSGRKRQERRSVKKKCKSEAREKSIGTRANSLVDIENNGAATRDKCILHALDPRCILYGVWVVTFGIPKRDEVKRTETNKTYLAVRFMKYLGGFLCCGQMSEKRVTGEHPRSLVRKLHRSRGLVDWFRKPYFP